MRGLGPPVAEKQEAAAAAACDRSAALGPERIRCGGVAGASSRRAPPRPAAPAPAPRLARADPHLPDFLSHIQLIG